MESAEAVILVSCSRSSATVGSGTGAVAVLLLPMLLSGCAIAVPHDSKAARQRAIRRGIKLMAAIIEGAISGPRRGS
ncbi:hypothetical protein GmRootV213_09020 [Variovorax sp. V213]